MSPVERLLANTVATEHGLIWAGAVNNAGYGMIYVRKDGARRLYSPVHRFWYEWNKQRSVKAGNDVHHTCHIRRCLTHLEEIDAATNRRDQWRSNKARRFRVASERRIYRGIVATSVVVEQAAA